MMQNCRMLLTSKKFEERLLVFGVCIEIICAKTYFE